MTSKQLARYRDLLAPEAVEEHAAFELAGSEFGLTLRPNDGAALAAVLEQLGADGRRVLVRGGGNRVESGNSLRGADVLLATDRLTGVMEFEAAEGVCRVAAGTALDDLRVQVNEAGWEVPLDPPGARTTVGGTIAAAAIGPRTLRHGLPRRAVLGLDVVLASGERTRCGGRVVKNVTGFDMGKLYTGSFGALGVIESAWLRLQPLPQNRRCFEIRANDPEVALRAGLAASRRNAAAMAAVRIPVPGAGAPTVCIEIAGEARSVDRDADWLCGEWNAQEAGADLVETVRELQAVLPGAAGLRFRIAALPSRALALHAALQAAGAELLAYPGLNITYAGFRLPPYGAPEAADSASAAFESTARATAAAGGHAICERAPSWAKVGRDMFGDVAAQASLFAKLKQGFDPGGVLNPGLFAGGL
jgi:glycolate oxidase FAD binding subunit